MPNDVSVQATNSSSILSKRSVEKLYGSLVYTGKPYAATSYFHHFVKYKRRSPAVNRGYLLRLLIVRQTVNEICKLACQSKDDHIYIVNLGCGFDPLAFEYLDGAQAVGEDVKNRLVFIDIDYKDLIRKKIRAIEQSSELRRIIGATSDSFKLSNSQSGVHFLSPRYIAAECNLNDSTTFDKLLHNLQLKSSSSTKIFIAEVSITYMEPQLANKIIASAMECPHMDFLILEHLIPENDFNGKFAKTMVQHFRNVNSPIKSVEKEYRTVEDQTQRFNKLCNGLGKFEITTLMEYWDTHIATDLKRKLDTVEEFDEYEEFILFCMHYYFGHYTNGGKVLFPNKKHHIQEDCAVSRAEDIPLRFSFFPMVTKRRYAAACGFDDSKDSIFYNSGFAESRVSTSVLLEPCKEPAEKPFIIESHPPSRLCHSVINLSSSAILLVGGRSSPLKILSDSWMLQKSQQGLKWHQVSDMNAARSRLNWFMYKGSVVVCNGSFSANFFEQYDGSADTWTRIPVHTNSYLPRKGASVAYDEVKGVGIIVGGMLEDGAIDDGVYKFTITEEAVVVRKLYTHWLAKRFGSRMDLYNGKMILIGGVSNAFVCGKYTSIVLVDEKAIGKVRINDDDWEKFPLLVNGDTVNRESDLAYVGGGAVCFGFGSYWNELMLIGDRASEEIKFSEKCEPCEEEKENKMVKKVVENPAKSSTEKQSVKSQTFSQNLVEPIPIEQTNENLRISTASEIDLTTFMSIFQQLGKISVTECSQENAVTIPLKQVLDPSYTARFVSIQPTLGPHKVFIGSKKTVTKLYSPTTSISITILLGKVWLMAYPPSQAKFFVTNATIDPFNKNPRLGHNTNRDLTPYETTLIKGQTIEISPNWTYSFKLQDKSAYIETLT